MYNMQHKHIPIANFFLYLAAMRDYVTDSGNNSIERHIAYILGYRNKNFFTFA